jgi:transcriptional regulator with XRE-family HTH domain
LNAKSRIQQPVRTAPARVGLHLELERVEREEKASPILVRSRQRGLKLPHLRAVREECGLSQRELSGVLGRNHDYVGVLERGRRGVIGVAGVAEIAKVLGVHPAALTDAASLESYLSEKNHRVNNLRKTAGVGEVLGKVLAFFKTVAARAG